MYISLHRSINCACVNFYSHTYIYAGQTKTQFLHWAYTDAVHVFTFDTGVINNIGHYNLAILISVAARLISGSATNA